MLKRTLLVFGLALGLFSMNGSIAFAQSITETVSATVTVQSISLTVSPTSINYGTIPFQASRKSTHVDAGNVIFTATNTGNIAEDFNVRGSNAAGTDGLGGFTWTLVDGGISCESPGNADKFRHSVSRFGESLQLFLLASSDASLATGVAPAGTQDFTSEFYTPCFGSRGAGVQATTNIVVSAVAP